MGKKIISLCREKYVILHLERNKVMKYLFSFLMIAAMLCGPLSAQNSKKNCLLTDKGVGVIQLHKKMVATPPADGFYDRVEVEVGIYGDYVVYTLKMKGDTVGMVVENSTEGVNYMMIFSDAVVLGNGVRVGMSSNEMLKRITTPTVVRLDYESDEFLFDIKYGDVEICTDEQLSASGQKKFDDLVQTTQTNYLNPESSIPPMKIVVGDFAPESKVTYFLLRIE